MVAVIEMRVSSNRATQDVNVWHWRIPESSPVTEVNAAITALDTFYGAIAAHLQSGIYTVEGLVRTVDQNPNEYISGSGLTTTASGTAGANLAGCAVLALKSAVVGGSRRGRKYLGPLPAGSLNSDGRTLTSTAISVIVSAATTLMGTTTSGIELGVWSRKFSIFTPVTAVGVQQVVGIQRRRLT